MKPLQRFDRIRCERQASQVGQCLERGQLWAVGAGYEFAAALVECLPMRPFEQSAECRECAGFFFLREFHKSESNQPAQTTAFAPSLVREGSVVGEDQGRGCLASLFC